MGASSRRCPKAGDITLRSTMDVRRHRMPHRRTVGLVVERAIMELAEILVLVGMVGRHVVGESEEKESKGFSRDEVEAGLLDTMGTRFGFGHAATGLRNLLHLLESVHDRGVELVFVGEVVLKVAAGCKRLWTEGTPVLSGKSTKEMVEMELTECGGGVLTALTTEEGKVTSVHLEALSREERWVLIQPLTCRGVGRMLVDEVCFEAIPIFE
jgi:hypothetical protein